MTKKGGNSWNMLTKGEAVGYGLLIFFLGAAAGYGASLL